MKVKEYRVEAKKYKHNYYCAKDDIYYIVDAPSKRIAKWCGANLWNNEYSPSKSAKDMVAKRIKD